MFVFNDASARPRGSLLGRALLASLSFFTLALPAPSAWAETSCSLQIADEVRVGRHARVGATTSVLDVDGLIRISGGGRFDSCTEAVASSVELGDGASVYDLAADTVAAGPSSEIRGGRRGFEVPHAPACIVTGLRCEGVSVEVPVGETLDLEPGSYRGVVVEAGAELRLGAGAYWFCRLRLADEARLLVDGAGTQVRINRGFRMGTGAEVLAQDLAGVTGVANARRDARGQERGEAEPDADEGHTIGVGGGRVRIGVDAILNANLVAPNARIRSGRRSEVTGSVCAESLRVGARASFLCPPTGDRNFCFRSVASGAGAVVLHQRTIPSTGGSLAIEGALIAGGVGAGDYDGDGWVDLYVVGGDLSTNVLLRNLGDGTFEDQADAAGVAISGEASSGPLFGDYDGDGDLDLFLGAVNSTLPRMFSNNGDGTFSETTEQTTITNTRFTFGASYGDYDLDGDLDLCLGNWSFSSIVPPGTEAFWKNNGDGSFTGVTEDVGFGASSRGVPNLFSPNFVDYDDDGDLDLLLASDFGNSQVRRNDDGVFTNVTTSVISDENGMGAAIGDYDNDGDLDWFVTSIWDPDGQSEGNWGVSGNRLYRNDEGAFVDVTEAAGVEVGYWGWGACFADFDLDGNLDVFHTNGFGTPFNQASEFHLDPAVLFMSNGDGTFTERAFELGIPERAEGRGIVCFDYDRDGDVDIFVTNNDAATGLYRNEIERRSWLAVRLDGLPPNTEGIGSRVFVTTSDGTQMRLIRAGTNFESQDPAEAHFGLGDEVGTVTVRVEWLYGGQTVLEDVDVNQLVRVPEPEMIPSRRVARAVFPLRVHAE